MDHLITLASCLVGGVLGALWVRYWDSRNRPFEGTYAVLKAKPGATCIDFMNDGGTQVIASLVLKEIARSRTGPTTATFIDKTWLMKRNTYRG